MSQISDDRGVDRRTVLRSVGTVAAVGMLAGCSGGDSNDGSDGSDGSSGDGGSGDDGSDGGSGSSGNGSGGGGVPEEVDSYLSDAKNYDGSIEDATGAEEVVVDVGAGNTGLAFGPAAVRVDAGTTVVWEWTGQGGNHNVVAEDGEFRSGNPGPEGPFEYTFEESGNYTYYCSPHELSGMKGAVIVE